MPVDLSWLVENKIIYGYGYGVNEVADLIKLDIEMSRFLEASSAKSVHTIYNLHDLKAIPPLFEQVKIRWKFTSHPKLGWTIFVGVKDPVQKLIISIFGNLLKMRIRSLAKMPEALDFLQTVDTTLPDLEVYKHRFKNAEQH